MHVLTLYVYLADLRGGVVRVARHKLNLAGVVGVKHRQVARHLE